MKMTVLYVGLILILAIPVAVLLFPRSRILRVVAALPLVAFAGFCVFGFIASGEAPGAQALWWRAGYGGLFLISLISAYRLIRNRPALKSKSETL